MIVLTPGTLGGVLVGLILAGLGLMLTFVWPIQRGRFRNQLWDAITLALFTAGSWLINYWDLGSNILQGLIVGGIAIVIRDVRLWATRFRDQTYRRGQRYYWYGRARDWYGSRRRRRY